MAIPTMELGHIYEAGENISDTIEAMQAAQDDLRALVIIVVQRTEARQHQGQAHSRR